jgi:hypothetical protein
MPLEVEHNVNKRLYALLNAPKDIDAGTKVSNYARRLADASAEHQKLFSAYRNGYKFFYPHAEKWWRGCIAAQEEFHPTRAEAIDAAYDVRLAGPASVPEYVWFIRYFWLKCDGINKAMPIGDRVAPEQLLLQWLVDAGDTDYVTLVTCMPYWPMGVDEQGEWC